MEDSSDLSWVSDSSLPLEAWLEKMSCRLRTRGERADDLEIFDLRNREPFITSYGAPEGAGDAFAPAK